MNTQFTKKRILIDYLLNVGKRNFAYISKKLSWSQLRIWREIKRNTHDGIYLVSNAKNIFKEEKIK